MAKILITGASGYIGKALAQDLAAKKHEVICMSRHNPGLPLPWVRGEFYAFEDLRRLDEHKIDAVVHLAAVTGGCLERDGLEVNVEGTRCLMRYLIDRGCTKFVNASSIAVVGLQSVKFRPLEVPIGDEHPCLDRDGYGFSKYMMEEVTRYLVRQNPQIDVINLRLASVPPAAHFGGLAKVGPAGPWCLAGLTQMSLADAVRAFALAAEAGQKPGLRIMNAVTPMAWVADPVADILRNWWGHDVDLSYFARPENRFASVFACERIREELGFVAQVAPKQAVPATGEPGCFVAALV